MYGESAVHKKSHENPYQVLQVMCAASERAMKVRMIKSLSPYSTKLYRKKYHEFVAIGILTRAVH